MTKTYSELVSYQSFIDRFRYLKLDGVVGEDTFGFNRYLNQQFYRSADWKQIISRDMGCDLAHPDFEILGSVVIHHLNPITKSDLLERSDFLFNPEFLVCVSHNTHKAIHYGDESLLMDYEPIIRRPNDMCPWR